MRDGGDHLGKARRIAGEELGLEIVGEIVALLEQANGIGKVAVPVTVV